MLKALSILALLSTLEALACQLKQPIVSLSAPVTGTLQELGLLRDPRLLGISSFHPVGPQEFKGVRLGGGLFLSAKGVAPYRRAHVFFDESEELTKRLKTLPFNGRTRVRTRLLDPFTVTEGALIALDRHLGGCERKIVELRSWLQTQKSALLARAAFKTPLYFFVGEFSRGKWPELIMANDGPVAWWREHGKLVTLDSPLAYVRWSEKWRVGLTGQYRLVGLSSGSPTRTLHLRDSIFQIHDAEALSPGPAQIRFMRRLSGSDW
jgi:hypothetical protein